MTYEICDVHAHILPNMDDGCKTPEESIAVLQACYAQGVRRVFATPHYYPVETVEAFLKRRDASMALLSEHIAKCTQPLPEICLGAEVAYRPGIDHEKQLQKLCLGKSNYLLLELPMGGIGEDVVRTVRNICFVQGVTPIIAHVERYMKTSQMPILAKILKEDVLVQLSAAYLLKNTTRRQGKRLIQDGFVQLLGTDMHNNETRKPNLAPAVAYLEKKRMHKQLEAMQELCRIIYSEATGTIA